MGNTETLTLEDYNNLTVDVNGKADKDLSNVAVSSSFSNVLNTAEIRTVVETYVNGTSWYRLWSDGWCEQGAYLSWSGAWTTINLLKAYKDSNYTVVAGGYRTDNSPGQCMLNFKNYTTTTFDIWSSDDASSNYCECKWKAQGYIN